MQVTVETTSSLERRLTVGVPAEQVDGEVTNRLKKAAKNVRLPGFRPGKVPMKVMHQRFGANVRQEVLGEVVSQSFRDAVIQENLRPAGEPVFEPKTVEQGKDIQYVATFEIFPEVEFNDMAGVEIERPVAEVTEGDLDQLIQSFCEQQGTWPEVERAAKLEDKVVIDYAGTRDGDSFDGGSADGQELSLGAGSMIPGFEDGIVGMKPGEERTLQLAFPEDYHNDDLKGAAVEFVVKLNAVKELLPAPVDAELFAKYGVEGGDEKKFRTEIEANMNRELANVVQSKIKQQTMDAVVDAHEGLEIPQGLIDQEIGALRQQMLQQFGGAGQKDLDLQSLLPDDMFQENAVRRVKLGLLLSEFVTRHDLKADADRVRGEIEALAATYETPEEVIEYYYGNQEQLSAVESKVVEDMIVDKLLENAHVTEKPCSYQEAVSR